MIQKTIRAPLRFTEVFNGPNNTAAATQIWAYTWYYSPDTHINMCKPQTTIISLYVLSQDKFRKVMIGLNLDFWSEAKRVQLWQHYLHHSESWGWELGVWDNKNPIRRQGQEGWQGNCSRFFLYLCGSLSLQQLWPFTFSWLSRIRAATTPIKMDYNMVSFGFITEMVTTHNNSNVRVYINALASSSHHNSPFLSTCLVAGGLPGQWV